MSWSEKHLLYPFIEEREDVMPKKKDKYIQQGQILDAGIEVDEYMPGKTRLNVWYKNRYSEQMF